VSKYIEITTKGLNQTPLTYSVDIEKNLDMFYKEAKSSRPSSLGRLTIKFIRKVARMAGMQLVLAQGIDSTLSEAKRLYPGKTPAQVLEEMRAARSSISHIHDPSDGSLIKIIADLFVEEAIGFFSMLNKVQSMTKPVSSWEMLEPSQPADLEEVSDWLFRGGR